MKLYQTTGLTRPKRILSRTLRLGAGAAFLLAGGAKLAGLPMMVDVFDRIGFGQWFRIVTGIVEVAGAVGLVLPATAAIAGLVLSAVMACAALTHLFLIGGSPLPALLLMHATGAVTWLHRGAFDTLRSRGKALPRQPDSGSRPRFGRTEDERISQMLSVLREASAENSNTPAKNR